MKRAGALIVATFLTAWIIGCDSGIKEGLPSGPVQGGEPPNFRKMMEQAQQKKNEMLKGQGKKSGGAPASKAGP